MYKQIENILICPATLGALTYDETNHHYKTQNGTIYPIVNGIIDFLPDLSDSNKNCKDNIADAYDSLSSDYDNFLTSQSFLTKIYNLFFRGFVSDDFAYKTVDFIPDDTKGVLLDVPVGTGLFTVQKYKKLKNATILVIEYSMNMLLKTQQRFKAHNIDNVYYIRADMSQMPFKEDTIDTLLTMNGFHALARKDRALEEVNRILKPAGQLSGCFYIKGKRRLTDIFVKFVHEKKGWFTGPFYTEKSFDRKFGEFFKFYEKLFFKPIILFNTKSKKGC